MIMHILFECEYNLELTTCHKWELASHLLLIPITETAMNISTLDGAWHGTHHFLQLSVNDFLQLYIIYVCKLVHVFFLQVNIKVYTFQTHFVLSHPFFYSQVSVRALGKCFHESNIAYLNPTIFLTRHAFHIGLFTYIQIWVYIYI